MRTRRRRFFLGTGLFVTVALAAVLPACSLSPTPSGYDITAVFSRAIGLYPNSHVRIQGVNIGEVTKIKNNGNLVVVTMRINGDRTLPAGVSATQIPASLLGERYVQLSPAYTGGATFKHGGQIPEARTTVPAEFDELLRSLQNFTGSIDPKNASDLVTNLAALLAGQGKSLNDLIDSGAGTLQLLANKSGELGDIVDSLSTLTTALQGHTAEIQKLISDYDTLAGVLAANSGDLNRTITSVDALATEVTDLLQNHAQTLPFDVDQLTHATRTLDRNFDSLSTLFSSTVKLFDAAGRAYDPLHNALSLNAQLAAGYTSELIANRLRDRISGICRRLNLTALCGDPNTSPFNSIVNLIPTLIGKLPGVNGGPVAGGAQVAATAPAAQNAPAVGAAAPSLASLLQGLNLSADQRNALTNLSQNILPVIQGLNDDQLIALESLTPPQLAALGKLPADQIPGTLTAIRAGSLTPDSLLQPALPALPGSAPTNALNTLLNSVLNALGTLGGH